MSLDKPAGADLRNSVARLRPGDKGVPDVVRTEFDLTAGDIVDAILAGLSHLPEREQAQWLAALVAYCQSRAAAQAMERAAEEELDRLIEREGLCPSCYLPLPEPEQGRCKCGWEADAE